MLEAVLFDWGDTLMQFDVGRRARSTRAIAPASRRSAGDCRGRRVTARFREDYEPLLLAPGHDRGDRVPGLVRELLAHFGVELDDEELGRFLEAEHAAWEPAAARARTTHALLESLRARGLKLGARLERVRSRLAAAPRPRADGLAERIDFAVFSSEVGKRKPHPAIFERALERARRRARARRSSSATGSTRTSAARRSSG